MKVLWFANTPCGAAEKLNLKLNTGGWLKSLEEELVKIKNLDLSICFYWDKKIDPFRLKKTIYYPIFQPGNGSKIKRLYKRALRQDDDNNEISQLLKIIESVNPDIIHIHGTENNYGLIQGHTKIPVVISIQGILSAYTEKFFSGIPLTTAYWYEYILPKLLFKSVMYTYDNLYRSAIRERNILSMTKYIIGRTDWDKRITNMLAPSSHYYVNNEILRNSFYGNTWQKSEFDTPLQLVTIMSDGLYKGLETIVKTSIILSERKIINFKWVIIGQSKSSYMVKLVERWLKVDFEELNIELIGSRTEKEIVDTLIESNIYCQVSHIENSPNSLCEAMLLGVPSIATFAGGTDSILENKKEGILIQEGDPYSLAGAIVDMSKSFSKAIEYGSQASIKSKLRHNKSDITNKLYDIYTNILLLENSIK